MHVKEPHMWGCIIPLAAQVVSIQQPDAPSSAGDRGNVALLCTGCTVTPRGRKSLSIPCEYQHQQCSCCVLAQFPPLDPPNTAHTRTHSCLQGNHSIGANLAQPLSSLGYHLNFNASEWQPLCRALPGLSIACFQACGLLGL